MFDVNLSVGQRLLKLSLTRKISVPQDILVQDLGGESVILNLQDEQYFGLDDVGTYMWQTLIDAESIQAAYDMLLAEYSVEPEQLHQDLEQLIEQLVEHGLVEVTN